MLDWFKWFATPDSCVESIETESPTAVAEGQAERLLEGLESFRRPANEPAQTRVIVVASQKGGTGKTTVAAHLGVEAAIAGQGPTVLIDTDPQGSLSEWWEARDGYLQCDGISALVNVKLDDLAAELAELRRNGTVFAIIDTPPAHTTSIEKAIAMADLVVIPARPSPHDLRAIGATVNMARSFGKPYFFVINGATPRAHLTAQSIAALSEHGRVAPVILHQRTNYASSMIDGGTVMEASAPGRSADEVAQLWQYLQAQVNMPAAA
jgi:chromosome partitioning protein